MDRFDHCDNGTFCAENKPLDPDRMDEVQAHPVRIGAFADKTPERPVGLTDALPETSRFLDALEKKYREDHKVAARALSFGEYGKAGDS